jgi:hypothetical protein
MRLQFLLLAMVLFVVASAQQIDWKKLSDQKVQAFTLTEETFEEQTLQFQLSQFGMVDVTTDRGSQQLVRVENGAQMQIKGQPDLDMITQSIMIHPTAKTQLEIIGSTYKEFENVEVAPSKGILTRNKNPQTIPYEYGEAYSTNAFFPGKLAELGTPYIIRDVRGQAIKFYPLQYNPQTKVLRVYTSIEVKVKNIKEYGINPLLETTPEAEKTALFENVYQNHFLNYPASRATLAETGGKMLIICYDNFASTMQSFVDWKTSIGMQVEMVNYSTIGSASAIKTYVANYYNQNGLTFLLLVGDNAQVPTSSTSAGDSDNNYGYIVGSDHYLDIFVGRFSAENTTQLSTMVDRTIYYERDMSSSDAIISKGIGIASNEGTGGGGDNNESDEQHMNNIENDLEGYGYAITRCYQNGGSTSQLSSLVNSGAGIINYVGHGSNTGWYAPSFTVSNVNALTNTNKYPFIISVACVVGNFKNITCYAESWIRASNGSSPTGGLVFCGSTINQSWASPMRAQDVINDLLVANTYKTYGGLFVNGVFAMIDAYGSDGENMADTWTVFGDPSVQTRTPGHPNGPQGQTTCGTPSGLASANITTNSATVSWNAVSDAVSYTLAYKTESASTWTEVTQTSTSKNLTGLAEATTYQFKVKSTCSQGASSYSAAANFTTGGNNYCTSSGNDYSYEWIAKVQFNTFTNSSSGAGYADFTSSTVTLPTGGDVDVTLTPGFKSSTYTEYWAVYIDFNGDKDFEDAGEEVFTSNGTSAVNGSFTVPSSANGTTRMRVVMTYNTASSPCGSYSYGETEDYTVTFGATPITYCDASGNNYSYEWIAGFGLGSFVSNSNAAGYTDFTNQTISVTAGESYAVNLTPGFASSAYMEYWKVWIDANRNGSFDDSGELLYSGNSNAALSGSLTIPSSCAENTRLRVVMQYNAAPSSCGSFSYGEVEDYNVVVARNTTGLDNQLLENALSIMPNPNNGNFVISTTQVIKSVKMYSTSGQLVYQNNFIQGMDQIEISNTQLNSGVYFLMIQGENELYKEKVMVK